MNAADPGWRQLGAVLLEAGLLSEHDLAAALAEQQRSGRRLGEILVTRGLVSKAALANALAEQHGGLLRTEHGFGTGLRGLSGSPPAGSGPEQAAASPPLSLTQPPEPPLSDEATSTVGGAEHAEGLETAPGDLPGLPERPSGTTAAPPLTAVQTTSPEQQRDHECEVEPRPPPELAHLLFVPTPGGYLLLQSGQAPAVGEEVELPEAPTRLVVAKVARSPLPLDERICAYLQAR
jgi:hypothetical protein